MSPITGQGGGEGGLDVVEARSDDARPVATGEGGAPAFPGPSPRSWPPRSWGMDPARALAMGLPPLLLAGLALVLDADSAVWLGVAATAWSLGALRLVGDRLTRQNRRAALSAILHDTLDDPLALTMGGETLAGNAPYLSLCPAPSGREGGPAHPAAVLQALCADARSISTARGLERAAAEGRSATASLMLRTASPTGSMAGAGPRGGAGRSWQVSVRPAASPPPVAASRGEGMGARPPMVWRLTRLGGDEGEGANTILGRHSWSESWDLAPLGVLEVNAAGVILRVNATVAGWLETPRADLEGGRPLRSLRASAYPGTLPPDRLADLSETGVALKVPGRAQALWVSVLHVQRPYAGLQPPGLRPNEGGAEPSAGHDGTSLVFLADLGREQALIDNLRRAEHRFQRFFQFAPTGLAFIDAEFRLTECNQTFLTLAGLDAHDAIGRPVAYLFQKEDRRALLINLGQVLAGGEMAAPQEARLSGGRKAVVHAYVRRFDAEGGGGLILHLVDMTEQKNLENQFVQSQKMQAIGQLAGGVAHDFNNLLTAMIGFCDLLLLRHKPGDQSFSDIMQIKQNANRAANLVRQLLAFSRQQTLQPRVLDVTDVLAELSNLLRRLIGENIDLRMVHGRDLGLVRVDQGQLEQVIINLAVNARDAMPRGGSLTIATSHAHVTVPQRQQTEEMPPGDYVRIDVTDTGIGIPMENLPRIFEPFFSTKEVGSGTGLGLSTVYGIVRQTGGYVFVESEPGQGARFTIHLPRLDAATSPAVPEEAPARGVTDLTGMGTVLLVEDEDAVRVFGARALRNKGYRVQEARSGEEALALLREPGGDKVDLIISDVVMPQMDGPTLIETVRGFRPDVKVIFISGYAEDRLRHSFKDEGDGGSVDFLPKPFSLRQLAAKVKEVMGDGASPPSLRAD